MISIILIYTIVYKKPDVPLKIPIFFFLLLLLLFPMNSFSNINVVKSSQSSAVDKTFKITAKKKNAVTLTSVL